MPSIRAPERTPCAPVRQTACPCCRFDLFHAHLFLDHRQLEPGLLFHAQEYPAFHPDIFPYNLGFCQVRCCPLAWSAPPRGSACCHDARRVPQHPVPLPAQDGSDVGYSQEQMALRNVLWWQGRLHVLDLSRGSALRDGLLRPDDPGADIFFTVDEALFGQRVIDISYFEALAGQSPEHRLFVC